MIIYCSDKHWKEIHNRYKDVEDNKSDWKLHIFLESDIMVELDIFGMDNWACSSISPSYYCSMAPSNSK